MIKSDRHNRLPSSISSVSWESQAKASVAGLKDTKFRSPALSLEVKLLEALGRGRTPAAGSDEDAALPNALKAAVCLELLHELEQVLGPFSSILGILRTELANCIYSDFYLSNGGTATFDQIPYFIAVERLEAEKAALLSERARFMRELKQRAADIHRIDTRTATLELQLRQGDVLREKLEAQLAETRGKLDQQGDVEKSAKEESLRMKKDLLRTKEELQRMRLAAVHEGDNPQLEKAQKMATNAQRELMKATAQVDRLKHDLAMEVERNAGRPTPEALDDALERAERAESQVEALRHERADGALTPRPDWTRARAMGGERGAANPLAISGPSSRAYAEVLVTALERSRNESTLARAEKAEWEIKCEHLQVQVAALKRELEQSQVTGGVTSTAEQPEFA